MTQAHPGADVTRVSVPGRTTCPQARSCLLKASVEGEAESMSRQSRRAAFCSHWPSLQPLWLSDDNREHNVTHQVKSAVVQAVTGNKVLPSAGLRPT